MFVPKLGGDVWFVLDGKEVQKQRALAWDDETVAMHRHSGMHGAVISYIRRVNCFGTEAEAQAELQRRASAQ